MRFLDRRALGLLARRLLGGGFLMRLRLGLGGLLGLLLLAGESLALGELLGGGFLIRLRLGLGGLFSLLLLMGEPFLLGELPGGGLLIPLSCPSLDEKSTRPFVRHHYNSMLASIAA